MLIEDVLNPGTEPCPTANLDGFFIPPERLVYSDGRLHEVVISAVVWGDASRTLSSAAVFKLMEHGHISISGVDRSLAGLVSNALADLSVTGTKGYGHFRRIAINSSGEFDIEQLRARVLGGMINAASRLSTSIGSLFSTENQDAVRSVIDRAILIVWALHGPSEYRKANRVSLGWLAVSAEHDQPSRPVNIPSTVWPTRDIDIIVAHHRRETRCRIRYAIAGARDFSTIAPVSGGLPNLNIPPVINAEADIIIFIHGHSSRLEEAGKIYEALSLERSSCSSHKLALISFDLPTHGYSEYIDHEVISPLPETNFVPDRPRERRFGILEFFESCIVSFVEALDAEMKRAGQAGILHRISAIIGGSLGGNLCLRLSEHLVTNPSWLKALVAWSPASAPKSLGRWDPFVPSPGEDVLISLPGEDEFGAVGHTVLSRPRDRCDDTESSQSRSEFICLVLAGERIINDGTPEFEAWTRILVHFGGTVGVPLLEFVPVLGPTLGPFTPALVPGINVTFEHYANRVGFTQSETWLGREDCAGEYKSTKSIKTMGALMSLIETYSSTRRRMHWRVAYEQLLFSHTDEVLDSRGRPCFEASEVPLLLIAGSKDNQIYYRIYDYTREFAPRMVNNPGRAVFVQNTGHSIHDERPRWLAREISRFVLSTIYGGFLRFIELFALGGDSVIYHRWQCEPNAGWSEEEGWGSLGGTNISQIAVGANADGRMELFAIGGDGTVYHRWQREPNGAWNEEGWGSLGGTNISQIAVGANADGRMELFAIGGDGTVYHRWQREPNGAWNEEGWGSLGGTNISQIAVGANADGRMELFAIVGDGTVYHRWQREPNGEWNEEGWGSLGGANISHIAIGANADGRMELFAIVGDGTVYHRWQREPNGEWNEEGWGSLGGANISQITVSANADGRMELFAIGGDGTVYHRWQREPNGGWNEEGWGSLGGTIITQVMVGATWDGRVELFAIGGDKIVYRRWQREPNGGWNEEGWGSVGGTNISQITVAANEGGRMGLFAIGGDKAVYHRSPREPNAGWSEGWNSRGGTNINQIAAGATGDGRVGLFAIGGDRAVYHCWQHEPNGVAWNEEGWGSLGGTNISQIVVGANADGRMELFAIGGDKAVYHRWQRKPNGGWNEEGWVSLGGTNISQIAVGANADGRMELFAIGGDKAVYHRWQREPNGAWNEGGWGSLGGANISQITVSANADGRMELFAIGGDGTVYHRWQREPNGAWNEEGWVSLRGTNISQIVVGANADGRMELFAIGGDKAVYHRWQREPNGEWNEEGWGSLGGTNISQITVSANADGRMELFAIGGDKAVYHRWQREPNGGWNEESWTSLGGTNVRQITTN